MSRYSDFNDAFWIGKNQSRVDENVLKFKVWSKEIDESLGALIYDKVDDLSQKSDETLNAMLDIIISDIKLLSSKLNSNLDITAIRNFHDELINLTRAGRVVVGEQLVRLGLER